MGPIAAVVFYERRDVKRLQRENLLLPGRVGETLAES